MIKKYRFTGETKRQYGIILQRIEAIIDFGDVKKGEKGGWIEKEDNLSQVGNAWISGNAKIFGKAIVSGDARIFGKAWIFENAKIFGKAWIYGDARIFGKLKCEKGYYFARKNKNWKIEEIKIDDESSVLWHE